MIFEKTITVSLGNYENLKLTVSDAPSFEDCDKQIIKHLERLGIEVDMKIKQALGWQND